MSWPSATWVRAAVATTVMRNDAIAVLEEEQHLRIPVIGRQRPAVAEHNGLSAAASSVRTASARALMMPSMNSRLFMPHSQSRTIGSLSLLSLYCIRYFRFLGA